MTNYEIKGEIQQRDVEFDWKIENFSSLSVRKGHYCRSPSINFFRRFWHLRLYPKGDNYTNGEVILLCLVTKKYAPPLKIKYSLGIKDVYGVINVWGNYNKTFGKGCSGSCYAEGILRSELLRKKDELIPLDVLTLTFRLNSKGLRATSSPVPWIRSEDQASKGGGNKVLKDLKSLWLSGENSDVLIKVGDVQFKAHRAILAARIPAMSAMFKYDTAEKVSGVVTIEDCEPAVFRQFLHYIYTGALSELSTENASALYAVADKYLVSEVKELCVRYLQNTLCLNTIYDVVKLSLVHNEKKLLEAAVDLFAKNMVDMMKTVEWQRFMLEHTAFANEITISALELEKRKEKRAQKTPRVIVRIYR